MSNSLAHSVAEVIAQLLVDLGIATYEADTDWLVRVESEADSPDNTITVYDTVGTIGGTIMLTGERLEHYGVQIRTRSAVYRPGYRRISEIKDEFDAVHRVSVIIEDAEFGDAEYLIESLDRSSGPIHAGTEADVSQRDIFTINYLCTISRVS